MLFSGYPLHIVLHGEFFSFISLVRTAAEAALARIQGQKKDTTHFNTSLAAIRAQVQRELEAERKAKSDLEKQSSQEQTNSPKVLTDDHNPTLAAQGVYFRFVTLM